MGKVKAFHGRKILVDFTGVTIPPSHILAAQLKARQKNAMMRKLFPYQYILGTPPKYRTPEEMQVAIDEYFNSLMGPMINKYGQVVYDDQGKKIMVQIRPATISGLANKLGMKTDTIKSYNYRALAGLCDPQYSAVILSARQRIEQYAEERLYDRDGTSGAQFSLRRAFCWHDKLERGEIQKNAIAIEKMQQEMMLRAKEFELKRKIVEGENDPGDTELIVRVTRAKRIDE